MKNSGIGGQAVMEGVMMRNKNRYAVACRKPDGEIVVDVKETHSVSEKVKFLGWPFIRGAVNLIESMVIGIKALTYSADFLEDGTDAQKGAKKVAEDTPATPSESVVTTPSESIVTTPSESIEVAEVSDNAAQKPSQTMTPFAIFCTVALSLALTIALFFFLPVLITGGIESLTGWDSPLATSAIEGIVRMIIFIALLSRRGAQDDQLHRTRASANRGERTWLEQGAQALRYEFPVTGNGHQHPRIFRRELLPALRGRQRGDQASGPFRNKASAAAACGGA